MRLLSPLLALAAVLPASASGKVVAVTLEGVVHPITVDIIAHAIDEARRDNASLVLIRLNTPGGLLDATRKSIEKIDASAVPVVTYVTPSGGRAASAGFFLLEAGDVAAMAPGTNTGAATPVLLGQPMDPAMKQKVENDAAAYMRSLAARRSRNGALAEKTIYEAKAFTEKEALDNHLIELIAKDDADLLRQLNGREITRFDGSRHTLHVDSEMVTEYQKTIRETIIAAIADPNIGFILLVIGALGLYVEFSSPGLILPGVAGAILVLLALSSLSVFPINWVGMALFLLAFLLFGLEAKFASHGILGVGGTVSMILGALLLIDAPPALRIHTGTAVAVALPFAAITIFLMSLAIRARSNKVISGAQGMLGEIGRAHTALAPEGKVFVHGEYWDAVSPVPVEPGSRIRVVAVEGLRVRVEPHS